MEPRERKGLASVQCEKQGRFFCGQNIGPGTRGANAYQRVCVCVCMKNLAEAEYVVAVYMYMRVLGYPAERITLMTTYNGQKQLLRDVATHRCAQNPLFGMPSRITTVDKFQGSQNDYILLSLGMMPTFGRLSSFFFHIVSFSHSLYSQTCCFSIFPSFLFHLFFIPFFPYKMTKGSIPPRKQNYVQ